MTRLAAALAVVLAATCGTARADTFTLVPAAPIVLPSADVPNAGGSLLLPAGWTEAASGQPQALSHGELQALWTSAGNAYGIPWQVLAAINKIESNFGRNMGPSSAGAVGWMQFIPDTWLRWGLDASGDGLADPWNAQDAVYAAARYLAAAGGRLDVPRAIFAYNHADWYVADVLELAELYGRTGADVTFTLDQLDVDLERAQEDVAAASERLTAAVADARTFARREERLLSRAIDAELLSDTLALQRRSGIVGARRAAADARVEEFRDELALAEEALEAARQRSQGAAFAAGSLLGAPAWDGEYVFPVGGGPGVVSVGHDHHDYPAADIAAPAGSPVYALTDAVVESSWRLPTGRCGIGATLAAADGRSWTYCHLSYLDPAVEPGALLTAGAVVGLVGSTGHSTGPHLHLQLQPATSYPQAEAWFEGFAGTAFSWQDAAPRPVFAVVPDGVVAFTR